MPRVIRKLRHWKQRYSPNAAFICRRRMTWSGRVYEPGDPIPQELSNNKGKLRRFWESRWIELAEFSGDSPDDITTGSFQPSLPAGAVLEQRGSWFIVTLPDGTLHKAQGRGAYHELLMEVGDAPKG